MTVETVLEHLEGVRQVGKSRWRARCPAHDSTNCQVLSIAETSDGSALVHCFAGCNTADVVRALGLELHDLFPESDWQKTGEHASRPRRPRVDWPAVVAAAEQDLLLVKIVLAQIARRESLNAEDVAACSAAATRTYRLIQEARCA